MKDRKIADALRQIIRKQVNGSWGIQDAGATLAAWRTGICALIDVLDPKPSIESDTADEGLTGPENEREEVVGTSTSGKSRNLGNSGFSGGRPVRLAAA